MERKSIQELAAVLTAKSGLKKKEAERFATTIFDVVKENLLADRIVKIKGLGTFKIIDIESRESVNVNTGERMLIEGHNKITFTPDTTMKELVNRPFSQFETVILNEGVDFDDYKDNADEISEVTESSVGADVQEDFSADAAHSMKMTGLSFVEVEEVSSVENEKQSDTDDTADETEEMQTLSPVDASPTEEPEPESEQEIEQEPVSEPESESGAEPEQEEEQEEESVEEQETTAKQDEDEEDDDSFYGFEPKKKKRNYWQWLLIFFGALLCFILGYMLGKNHSRLFADEIEIEDVLPDSTDIEVAVKEAVKDTIQADTLKALKPEPEAEPQEEVKSEPQEEPKAEPMSVAPLNPVIDYRKFEKLDARVRTGAYRIVGTQEVVKVKAGETLRLLAKRYLGPDMECYIEVYNGLNANSQLKEGQTIKIPELKVKKRKK